MKMTEKEKAEFDRFMKRNIFLRKIRKAAAGIARVTFALFVLILAISFMASMIQVIASPYSKITVSVWAMPFIVLGIGLFPAAILLIVAGILAKPLQPLGDIVQGKKAEKKGG